VLEAFWRVRGAPELPVAMRVRLPACEGMPGLSFGMGLSGNHGRYLQMPTPPRSAVVLVLELELPCFRHLALCSAGEGQSTVTTPYLPSPRTSTLE
jgi:hypothetical protein